ncbi:MAG: trehalase family glycosidase [Christensenellales bacterium]
MAEFWLNDVAGTFEKTGKLYEKYDGEKGGAATVNEYGVPEMLGWTAGTFEKMLAEYKRADEVE